MGFRALDPVPEKGIMVGVDGRQFHVLRRGEGRPVVLLHGNGGLAQEILGAFPETPGICWIAPDRPGYGYSDALPDGEQDPQSQAQWLDAVLSVLMIQEAVVVAHSLAAAVAVSLAASNPSRVSRLVLLAPFCRPTPQRLMLGLRLTTLPVIGTLVRTIIVPFLARRFRRQLIFSIMGPQIPQWVQNFPVEHAVQPKAVKTIAAELTSFNHAMERLAPSLNVLVPVSILHGSKDTTAVFDWQIPWLLRHLDDWDFTLLKNCGHAVHHESPQLVIQTVLCRQKQAFRQLNA
ncbi:MAG: alpha/beta hydrolase fold [Cypionkella sp.]|nr:alpha/beta hydrolase fold [Cypionkella sp.]